MDEDPRTTIEDIEKRLLLGELGRIERRAREKLRLLSADDDRQRELWGAVLADAADVRRALADGNGDGAAFQALLIGRWLLELIEGPRRDGQRKGVATQQATLAAKVAMWQPRYTELRAAAVKTLAACKQIVAESKGTALPVTRSWCNDNLFYD